MSEKDLESKTPDEGSRPSTPPPESHALTEDTLQNEDKKLKQQRSSALEWDKDDKDNPHNWPWAQKAYQTGMSSTIALVVAIGSSIFTPGREEVQQEFNVSFEVSILAFVFYVMGLSLGPLIASPSSETFGRRIVYLTSLSLFSLFVLGAGFSQSIGTLIVCRFFAGFCGCPGLSIGGASIADVWPPAERAVPMIFFVSTGFLGPAVAPIIGAYATIDHGWRWTQWSLLFITAVCLVGSVGMKETYKPVILRHRAKKRGTLSDELMSTTGQQLKAFVQTQLKRPVHMLLVEPVVALFTLYVGINFGILYAFFASFPYIFAEVYGFGIGPTGLMFIGLGAGTIIAGIFLYIYSRTVTPRQMKRFKGKPPVEKRLYYAMIGSIALPISLFWFGWCAHYGVHWVSLVIAEAFYGFGNMLVVMSSNLYIVDFYGAKYGASAAVANNFMRYTMGFAFPLFIVQMYTALGIGWATSILGFIQLALTPIPWAFYVYGPRLRARSQYV